MDKNPINPDQNVDPFQPQAPQTVSPPYQPQPYQPEPQPVAPPPPSAPEEYKSRKIKWTYLLIVLLAIIVLALLGFIYIKENQSSTPAPTPTPEAKTAATPTPEATTSADTSDWQTYTNSKYGVSFKYPNTWLPKDVTSFANAVSLSTTNFYLPETTPIIGGEGEDGNEQLSFAIFNNKDLDNKVTTETKEQFISSHSTESEEIITLNGHPVAITHQGPQNPDNLTTGYTIWLNDTTQITLYALYNNQGQMIEDIFSTFKFN